MQSAIQKAKKLIKSKKTHSASAKIQRHADSLSRTQENDIENSALELKEFIELESKLRQQPSTNQWSVVHIGSHKKITGVAAGGQTGSAARQPFVGANKPEPVQNKLRDSLHERLGLRTSQKKDEIIKSTLADIVKPSSLGVMNKDLEKKGVHPAPVYRKRSSGATDRPSPIIKSKEDLGKTQLPRDDIGKNLGIPSEILIEEGLLLSKPV